MGGREGTEVWGAGGNIKPGSGAVLWATGPMVGTLGPQDFSTNDAAIFYLHPESCEAAGSRRSTRLRNPDKPVSLVGVTINPAKNSPDQTCPPPKESFFDLRHDFTAVATKRLQKDL